MPRENRKRGKKNKKKPDDDYRPEYTQHVEAVESHSSAETPGQPSWITPKQNEIIEVSPEAPFGYVDPDVKAYFRTVDGQIKEWQENEVEGEENQDIDPNEAKRLFFVAALTEMSGKEKQLATDPDCSVVLERMAYSMDDFVRRVFVDSLAGSYEALVKHRFASHVCQTLFTIAADTVSRECRGVLPAVPESSALGELRTLSHLVVDVCDEILPTLTSLIMDPFASHVIRAILLLLMPTLEPSDAQYSNLLRSKKSAAWKARQGPMKSVFSDSKGKGKEFPTKSTPEEFAAVARRFLEAIKDGLDDNEVRALAANKVASPVLQILLEVEAEQDLASTSGSLMDRVMVGIISQSLDDPESSVEPSDYLNTLLRDPTSSHLLETIVTRSPPFAFSVLWSTYFEGKLARLAGHPVANFVIAKAIGRASAEQLSGVCEELDETWVKLIKASRTGVLRALIDRASSLHMLEKEAVQAISSAFEISTTEGRNLLVPCVLRLHSVQEYQSVVASRSAEAPGTTRNYGRRGASNDPLEPEVQGAVLLQSLLQLGEPHNQIVIDSIKSLSIEELLAVAHHPISSRVLDALLESPTVPFRSKRQFVLSLLGNYQLLVDDRIGSRVGDRCWAFADTYLKEKIGRSLIPHEQFLAGSFYGKFFARNLNLYLLQRRPEEWKTMQAERSRAKQMSPAPVTSAQPSADPHPAPERKKRKRDTRPEDEIDAVFNATLGKKIKKGALGADLALASVEKPPKGDVKDQGLRDVLGAIRGAPKDEKGRGKHKR